MTNSSKLEKIEELKNKLRRAGYTFSGGNTEIDILGMHYPVYMDNGKKLDIIYQVKAHIYPIPEFRIKGEGELEFFRGVSNARNWGESLGIMEPEDIFSIIDTRLRSLKTALTNEN